MTAIIKNKMAALSSTSPTSLSSVVNTLSVSKARLKRKSKKVTGSNNTDEESGTPHRNDDVAADSRLVEIENKAVNDQDTPIDQEKLKADLGDVGEQLNKDQTPVIGETSSDNNVEDDSPVIYISIEVDRASPLKAKLLMTSLTVRVTFINELTGLPIKKSSQQISAVSYYENSHQNVDFVMPIMTKPATIESDRKGQLVARWSEDIMFCEVRGHLLNTQNVVILFELLVLPRAHQSPYPYAWGVLLPSKISLNDIIPVQLYKVPKRKRPTIKSSDLLSFSSPRKCPTVVYIKMSVGDITSLPAEPTLRSHVPTLPEVSQRNIGSMYPFSSSMRKTSVETVNGGDGGVRWSRLPGQPCAIPNELVGSISAGTNGCSALAFSPSGRLLASACISDSNQAVMNIYQVGPTGAASDWVFMCSLPCSMGIVYECVWSHDETKLACASGSGMCHVWAISEDCREQILPHPTYVYTLEWILNSSVIVSGCYDGALRCWKNEQLIEVMLTGGHRVNALCHDSSCGRVYSGTENGCITAWTVTDSEGENFLKKERCLDLPTLQGCSVQKLLLIPGQQRLVVHATCSPYHIVDLRLGSITASFTPDHPVNHPGALCVTPCGSLIITNNNSTTACFWDINKGTLVKKRKIRGLKGPLSAIKYHPFDHLAVFAAIGENQKIIFMKKRKE